MSEEELQEKGVSNNKTLRVFSDLLDIMMDWTTDEKKEKSRLRGFIHGVHHNRVGKAKERAGNTEGANAEYKRAEEQFSRCTRPSSIGKGSFSPKRKGRYDSY
jgi:hypothetical protein